MLASFRPCARADAGTPPPRRRAPLALVAAVVLAGAAPGPAASREAVTILALGDSLTAGHGLTREQAFPARLRQRLAEAGHDVRVLDAGVSGDTTTGGLARLDWVLAEPVDVAIVELGANDGLRGVAPRLTRRNLSRIVTRLRERGVAVLLTGMLAPPNMGPEHTAAFNAIFPELARELDVAFYPFFLEGVAGVPALNLDDGMHPNAAGVERIVTGILPFVVDVVETRKR